MADQPIGEPVPDWRVPPRPTREALQGRYCVLEPLARRHAIALWDAVSLDRDGRSWTYLSHGPYGRYEDFEEWISRASTSDDPLFYAICAQPDPPDPPGQPDNPTHQTNPTHPANPTLPALGVASFMRITPDAGTIEVGHILLSPLLQRTRAATEAMYLMMRQAFALGYRRYEWKCDALNGPSRAAAERLGFTYEGTFRQALVYKGRNRDTAWYSIIDREWPALRDAFEQWLSPDNFDERGTQRARLSALANSARMARTRT
jgi:RimJ/RimL family protein N-acetyltransferase